MNTVAQVKPRTVDSTPDFDVYAVREKFPILEEVVYGKELVYLDNAASSQKPLEVIETLREYYFHQHANVHRGVHALSERATEAYENARARVQQFLNARNAREIIFVRGTTEGLNLVATSYGRQCAKAGGEILVSEMEHHSNIVPWQLLAEQTGIRIRKIPMNDRGEIQMDAYRNLLNENTLVVAITYVANSLGTVNPVREMTELAHTAGAVVVVDAAQAAPHLKLDVQDMICDFLALSGHKMYGPTGIGVLYGREELLDAMPPYQGGGEMIKRVTFEGSEYAEIPHKFEAGTPNIADAAGLDTAIQFINEVGLSNIARHEAELLDYTHQCAAEAGDFEIYGTADDKAGVFAFGMENVHAHDIGTIVDREGVAIRVGHHCAMPVMQYFGISASARISFAAYNTIDEVDRAFDALGKVRELFKL